MSLMVELRPAYGPALVVGGGTVATRKVRTLLKAAFAVTVIAPQRCAELATLAQYDWHERTFSEGDTAPFALVFACTDDREVNRAIGDEARRAGKPVLVADAQDESTFFTPAIHRDGELAIAVSTGGASPRLARDIRDQVAASLGSGWDERVEAARVARTTKREDA